MTVRFKGMHGCLDKTEKDVVGISYDGDYFTLTYKEGTHGRVVGVKYPKASYEIESITK